MSNPFIVLFTARSGSTALFGNLKSVPGVTMRAEVFGNKVLPGDMEQTDDNRIKFLRRYWAPFKDGAEPDDVNCHGFKFQVTQDDAQFGQPARLVKVALQYSPRVVVLRRQNILKQAISALNAKRLLKMSQELKKDRGSAHILPEDQAMIDELRKTPMVLDFAELKSMLSGIKKSHAKLNRLAEAFGETHDITYEDYLADRDTVVQGVLTHIGADPTAFEPSDAYLKITSDSLQEVVKNYEGLKRFAADTEYAEMV